MCYVMHRYLQPTCRRRNESHCRLMRVNDPVVSMQQSNVFRYMFFSAALCIRYMLSLLGLPAAHVDGSVF